MSCAHMNPREACAACGAPRAEAAEANVRELEAALRNLVSQIEAVTRSHEYEMVWIIAQSHLGPYKGPTFIAELDVARAALRDTASVEGFFARGEDGQYHPDPAPPREEE
jgi:hypothetical protein